jgi:zinc-ribbon domain
MTCEKCGATLAEGARFCTRCGTKAVFGGVVASGGGSALGSAGASSLSGSPTVIEGMSAAGSADPSTVLQGAGAIEGGSPMEGAGSMSPGEPSASMGDVTRIEAPTEVDYGATRLAQQSDPGAGVTRAFEPPPEPPSLPVTPQDAVTQVPRTVPQTAPGFETGPVCPWCSSPVTPGVRFCSACGSSVFREGFASPGGGGGGDGSWFGRHWKALGGMGAGALIAAAISGSCVMFGFAGGDDNKQADAGQTATATTSASPAGTATATATATQTGTPTATPEPGSTETPTPPATATRAATATNTPTPRPGDTATPTPTRTPTPPPTPTHTNTPTATATPTRTPSPTATATATATRTPITYRFSASLNKSTYFSGETAVLCYHMEPQNIPYHVRVTQTAPGSPHIVAEFDDNGVGGGDCINLTVHPNDHPGFTLQVQAFIGNVVPTVHVSATVPE